MNRPELLYEVKIYETDKNSVCYRGRTSVNSFNNHVQRFNVSSDSD